MNPSVFGLERPREMEGERESENFKRERERERESLSVYASICVCVERCGIVKSFVQNRIKTITRDKNIKTKHYYFIIIIFCLDHIG